MNAGKFELVLLVSGEEGPTEQILHGDDLDTMYSIAADNMENNKNFLQAKLYFVEPKLIREWTWKDNRKEENNNAN